MRGYSSVSTSPFTTCTAPFSAEFPFDLYLVVLEQLHLPWYESVQGKI